MEKGGGGECQKDKVATRKFEHFTGEWGAVSQNVNLKYVVFIDGECYFEYHDGRTVIKPMLQWTLGTAAFAVKAKQWKEVEVEDGNKG